MFPLETVTFYCKKILQLITIFYMWSFTFLSSWQSINSHAKTYKGYIEDKRFKSFSCQVTKNMETTLQVNDYKFDKPGKRRNNKN